MSYIGHIAIDLVPYDLLRPSPTLLRVKETPYRSAESVHWLNLVHGGTGQVNGLIVTPWPNGDVDIRIRANMRDRRAIEAAENVIRHIDERFPSIRWECIT